jgi:hypothetical protein
MATENVEIALTTNRQPVLKSLKRLPEGMDWAKLAIR